MKTYKKRFLEACHQIADEYESEKGHYRCMIACPMCLIYNYNCSLCGINYLEEIFGCVSQHTAKSVVGLKNGAFKSSLRTKFYRQIIANAISLPAKDFTPSTIKSGKSKLLRIVEEVDRKVF